MSVSLNHPFALNKNTLTFLLIQLHQDHGKVIMVNIFQWDLLIIIWELFSMKNSEKQFELKISGLEFVVKPLQMIIREGEPHSYLLEFDKGAQILKKFDEQVKVQTRGTAYSFSKGEQGRFKLQNERNCGCEWGIYRKSTQDLSQFIDSLPVAILQHYTAYANSLRTMQVEYQHILGEHAQGREVGKLWDSAKPRSQWEFPNLTAKNRNGSIQLIFRLEIHCEVDAWVQAERKKVVKTAKSARSLRSNPEKQLNGSFQKDIHEEDQLLPKNSIISPTTPKEEHEVKTETKEIEDVHAINQIPHAHLPEVEPVFKKGSVLSDIIECSVQCSSNMNQKDKRAQLKEISGIPEEENELYSPYLSSLNNTKTQNFEAMADRQHQEAFKRRSNTYDSNYNEFPEENDSKRISLPQRTAEINRDEELGKEELQANLETMPQSQLTPQVKEKTVEKSRKRYQIIILIILLLIAGLVLWSRPFDSAEPLKQKKDIRKDKVKRVVKKSKKGNQ